MEQEPREVSNFIDIHEIKQMFSIKDKLEEEQPSQPLEQKQENEKCALSENEVRISGYLLKTDLSLGQGSFGSVFKGTHLKTKEQVAIKVESIKSEIPQLAYEFKLIKLMKTDISVGIPQVYDYQNHGDYNFMVMEELGESTQNLILKSKKGFFSLKSSLLLALQVVRQLYSILVGKNRVCSFQILYSSRHQARKFLIR